MDEERPVPRGHTLGNTLDRMSIRELEALRDACLAEARRIDTEIERKGRTRAAADSVFRP